MTSNNKLVLQRTPTETKKYAYAQGNVTLDFKLRTDIKAELKDFLNLLRAAVEDVTEDLEKRFPKK